MIRRALGAVANYFFATKARRDIQKIIDASNRLNWPDDWKERFEKYAKGKKKSLIIMASLPFLEEGLVAYTTFVEHKPEQVGWVAVTIGLATAQLIRLYRMRFEMDEKYYTVLRLASQMEDCERYTGISLDQIVGARS